MGWWAWLFGGGGSAIERIDGLRARALVEDGATLLDVRTPAEFAQGHLPNAVNIPVDAIARRVGELDRTKPVIVYCRSGHRSQGAGKQLRNLGFRDVYDLGSLRSW